MIAEFGEPAGTLAITWNHEVHFVVCELLPPNRATHDRSVIANADPSKVTDTDPVLATLPGIVELMRGPSYVIISDAVPILRCGTLADKLCSTSSAFFLRASLICIDESLFHSLDTPFVLKTRPVADIRALARFAASIVTVAAPVRGWFMRVADVMVGARYSRM